MIPKTLTANESLAYWLRKKGRTQAEIARRLGCTRQYVQFLTETAERKIQDAALYGTMRTRAIRFAKLFGGTKETVLDAVRTGAVYKAKSYGIGTHEELCAWLGIPAVWLGKKSSHAEGGSGLLEYSRAFREAVRDGAVKVTARMHDGSTRTIFNIKKP